jgi:hypothetical protein
MKLFRSTREIKNIFVLLGDKENDLTFSLGWVLSQSKEFLGALFKDLTGQTFGSVADAVVRLQTGRAGAGITDIEVDVGMDIAVIFEAKRGADLPSEAQLQTYDAVLGASQAKQKLLVALTNTTPEHGKAALSGIRIANAQLLHLSWKELIAIARSAKETTKNRAWLNDFADYVEMYLRPAHQPRSDYVAADKITKPLLLDLATKWPVMWTYHPRKNKLYFSCDNSTSTNASAMLDFAACKPFLGIGPADKSLKQVPGYDYWHVIG